MNINYAQDQKYTEVKLQRLQEPQMISSFIKFNKHNMEKVQKIQQKKLLHLRKKKNPLDLKQLVTKAKVSILQKNFVRKMKRGKVYRQIPHQLCVQEEQSGTSILGKVLSFLQNTSGLDLGPVMLCIWSFINIIQISIMIVIFSLQIAFPQTQNLQSFVTARIFSITLYVFDMILNFITQRHEIGSHKKNLKQIAQFYLTNQFTPDFFSIVMFPLSYLFEEHTITPFVMLVALFKLKNNLKRFESFQFIYVKTNSRQLYYSLIKVFLLNFSIGHILSIILNLMATLSADEKQSWYLKANIVDGQWVQKYIWGYYWGTNIMLSVGFGDISASNTTEATLLIFIQTLSCITLAYNISCVGSIISQLKAQNQEKKKRLKYFHRMCQENKISQDLEHKINNFIEQSYLIKQEFELQQYEDVLNSLPKNMQSEYRKQANKSLFDVGFFNSLNNKTVLNLAEYVIRKVAHPEQMLQKKGQIQNFCILQKGCLGFTCRSGAKSILNGTIMEKFQILKDEQPKILSLGFIKRKPLMYDIKSLFYSIYYYLPYEQLMNTLRFCEMDYHFFLYMKDKDESILGSNQIYKCKICQDDYHSVFECPKQHYIPLKQKVLTNYLKKQATECTKRNSIQVERPYRDFRTLYHIKSISGAHDKYLTENFDEDQVKQIKNMKKYYYEKRFKSESSYENILFALQTQKNPLQQQFSKIQDMLTKVAQAVLDFWLVESDVAFNFRYYFKEHNPNRLIQFKPHSMKKKAKDMIFGVYAFRKPTVVPPNATLSSTNQAFNSVLLNNFLKDEIFEFKH